MGDVHLILEALFRLRSFKQEQRLRLSFKRGKKEMPTQSAIAIFRHPSQFLHLGVKVPRGLLGMQCRVVYKPAPLLHQLCNLSLPSGFHIDTKARRSLKELMIM